jgi:hypothetical protein
MMKSAAESRTAIASTAIRLILTDKDFGIILIVLSIPATKIQQILQICV